MHNFSFPTDIRFGAGAHKIIPDILRQNGLERPLLITDKGLATLPILGDIKSVLSGFEFVIFCEIEGNPVECQVSAGASVYKTHEADCIIVIGGGAATDVAKAVAVMANHEGSFLEYSGAKQIEKGTPFLIALPTTAGTGSEVGRCSVISDDDTHVKHIICHPNMLPNVVIADAGLTVGLPANITASTGMDALTHLIEAYLTNEYHPICDGIALEGIKIVSKNLKKCVELAQTEATEEHLEARGNMLMASMMGAIAFQKELGVTHSCAHSLSTVHDLHHGLANAIMLPACMKFNAEAAPEKFSEMAHVAGLKDKSPEAFIKWIEELRADISIPAFLKDVDVGAEKLDDLVKYALADGCHQFNPRPVTKENFEQIYLEAIG